MNTNYSVTEGNRENEGCRFLAGSRILCFIRCLLFASSRQSSSFPPSCALVSISGFDFVNLCRKTRLRGIAARRPAYRGSEQILNVKIRPPITCSTPNYPVQLLCCDLVAPVADCGRNSQPPAIVSTA